MKMKKKFTAVILAAMLVAASSIIGCFAAENDFTVSLRIEGSASTLFYSDVTLADAATDEAVTVAQVLAYADEANEDLTVSGADIGYISEINGEKAGGFGGWDGWYYTVNGVSPDVGVGDYALSSGDEIVVYYGDYPCQLPRIDTSRFAADGTIKFTSADASYEYDEAADDWVAKTVTVPVTDMTVTLNGEIQLLTDENGEIKADLNTYKFTEPEISLQISKTSASGAPAVCRYAPDFKISAPVRNCRLYGDADLSGKVNILDAAYIQLQLARLTGSNFTPEQFIAADVDLNYEVNIKDASAIQLYLAKLGPELPIA